MSVCRQEGSWGGREVQPGLILRGVPEVVSGSQAEEGGQRATAHEDRKQVVVQSA